VASAADFLVEASTAAGVVVEFDPFAKDFDRVPGAALLWTFFEGPIALKIKQGMKKLNVADNKKNKICVTAL
jgi:hypothetical protein